MDMPLPKFKFNPDDALKDQLHISLVPANVMIDSLTFPRSWAFMPERDKDYRRIKPITVAFTATAINFSNHQGETFHIDLDNLQNITVGQQSRVAHGGVMLVPINEKVYQAVIAFQVRDGSHYYVTLPSFAFIPELFDYVQQHNLQINDPNDLQHHYDEMSSHG